MDTGVLLTRVKPAYGRRIILTGLFDEDHVQGDHQADILNGLEAGDVPALWLIASCEPAQSPIVAAAVNTSAKNAPTDNMNHP